MSGSPETGFFCASALEVQHGEWLSALLILRRTARFILTFTHVDWKVYPIDLHWHRRLTLREWSAAPVTRLCEFPHHRVPRNHLASPWNGLKLNVLPSPCTILRPSSLPLSVPGFCCSLWGPSSVLSISCLQSIPCASLSEEEGLMLRILLPASPLDSPLALFILLSDGDSAFKFLRMVSLSSSVSSLLMAKG